MAPPGSQGGIGSALAARADDGRRPATAGNGGKGAATLAPAGSGVGTSGPSYGIWTIGVDLDQNSINNHFDGSGGGGNRGTNVPSGQGFPGSAGQAATTRRSVVRPELFPSPG